MDKRIFICAAIISFLALVGFVLYSNLEIYERTAFSHPSRDVIANDYYALEQWLKKTGHPIRFEKNFKPAKFSAVEERVVLIHASASRWDSAEKFILPWIEQGGYLVVCLDHSISALDENLLELLSGFGVSVEVKSGNRRRESVPNFDRNISFIIDDGIDDADVFTINDDEGFARLVEIPLGDGALVVTGMPVFMYNNYLKEDENACLAWDFTGARADGKNSGVLFVRERYLPKNIFGKIMERGNLLPVIISAFLLIVLGFWMVIPVFGLTAVEKQKTSRPIRERFIAEIRFLKKYRALDHYLDVYEREKNPAEISENKKAYNYRELINQYRRIFNGTAKF